MSLSGCRHSVMNADPTYDRQLVASCISSAGERTRLQSQPDQTRSTVLSTPLQLGTIRQLVAAVAILLSYCYHTASGGKHTRMQSQHDERHLLCRPRCSLVRSDSLSHSPSRDHAWLHSEQRWYAYVDGSCSHTLMGSEAMCRSRCRPDV